LFKIIFTKRPYQGNEDILVKRNAVHIPSGLLLPPYNARLTKQIFDGGFNACFCIKDDSGNLSGAADC